MNNRLVVVKEIPIDNEPDQYYRIQVSYKEGGRNYFSGQNLQRGYYVSIQPVTIKGDLVSFVAFTGVTHQTGAAWEG